MSHQFHRTNFRDWTGNRRLLSLGTNAGAQTLPFQDWRRIKEAFAPELIERAVEESSIPVQRCIDPFGGSGTTGLACQFLGVHPYVVEVNPYLADLIEAKLTSYPSNETLASDLNTILENSIGDISVCPGSHFPYAPPTFTEPGHNGRWIFNSQVADRIVALRDAIESLDDPSRRLFRVLLGGILVEVSNVLISGKGRRYRKGWMNRTVPPERVTELFAGLARRAIEDIHRFGSRSVLSYQIRRGDSRISLGDIEPCELAVFSPPYANSSDYTDIYNVELWTLGYLDGPESNSNLRAATLSSHVQRTRDFPDAPVGSPALTEVLGQLELQRDRLWDRKIPAMVGAYFNDLMEVLNHLRAVLVEGGSAWIVVGDSRYADVQIPAAQILRELAENGGWEVLKEEPFRTMPTSAQQGREKMLSEQLIVLGNAP